jgi:DNA modification methylase
MLKPYYQDSFVTIYHGDCKVIMPQLPDFDLLLTDPPYGIGESNRKNKTRRKQSNPRDYGDYEWDQKPIPQWVIEMARSKCEKQVIFGGNYYDLPPCKGPLVWDKENTGDFADGEMAWNNLGCALRIKRHRWNGMLRKGKEPRFHPTQKPVEIMSWCLLLAGDVKTVLDPFMGSGTTLRACKDAGKLCVGIDLEERYCEIAARRMAQEVLPLYAAC